MLESLPINKVVLMSNMFQWIELNYEGKYLPYHIIKVWRLKLLPYKCIIIYRPRMMMTEVDLLPQCNSY